VRFIFALPNASKDMNTDTPTSKYGAQALQYAAQLVYRSAASPEQPGRGSTTHAEERAARYVRERLAALGVNDVRTQSFQGLRSIWFFLAFAFGFGLTGHVAFWLLRPALGGWIAWMFSSAAFGFGFYLLWRKFTFQDYYLRAALPHGPSQNVIAVIPAQVEMRQRVVLIGHLDSHRSVIWYAHDLLVSLYHFATPLAVYGMAAAPLFYGLSLLPGFWVLRWVAAALAVFHFFAWFSGVSADLGPYSPGANDNASAAGTLLALAERLQRQPLQHVEIWLAFTGCEETGCDGMRALLDKHGAELAEALFVDFELVGIGERLAYLQTEGVARRRKIPAAVEQMIQETGAPHGLQPVSAGGMGVFTEMGVVWERGLQGVCLMALRQDSPHLPEWHRPSDAPDKLEAGAFEKIHALAWDVLQRVDQKASPESQVGDAG
jgi:hypothetical protein